MTDDDATPRIGTIAWRDLTVEQAGRMRDFYGAVVGWEARAHDMGDYDDYEMIAPATGETAAGICHARGSNENLPPLWLVYVTVEDVDASAARCLDLGGRVLDGPRALGGQRFCVIQDPEGAVLALISG